MNVNEAKGALDSISEARNATVAASKAPPGYYSLLGLAIAMVIVSFSVSKGLSWAFLAAGAVLVVVAILWYERSVKTWSWGNLLGKGSGWFWLMTVVGLGSIVSSVIVREPWFGIAAGLVTVAVWSVVGPLWDRAYRAQLGAKE